jgi:hypothetical protein
MNDTRETYVPQGGAAREPRFKPEDDVVAVRGVYNKDTNELLGHEFTPCKVKSVMLDEEFGGWMVGLYTSAILIHEQNFVLAAELDLWDPHYDCLWSWWTKRENPPS